MLIIWKDIKGWEGWEELYEISDSGDVRNKVTNKLLTGDINYAGYYRVCLNNKNKGYKKYNIENIEYI